MHDFKYEKTKVNIIQGSIVIPAFNSISVYLIREYFRKTREIMRAYREGHTPGRELEAALKEYKSHQWVSTAKQL